MNDLHGYVGAYVADALDDELRIVFAEHLTECESCCREVQEFTETLALLSSLSASPPPPTLRAGVLDAIARTRVDPPEDPAHDRPADPPDSLRVDVLSAIRDRPADVSGPAAGGPNGSSVSARRAPRWLSLAVAASVIMAVLFGGFAVIQQRRLDQLEQAQRSAQPVAELLAAADLRTYPFAWPDGSRGSYLVSRGLDRALLTGTVPAAEPGRTYQAWSISDGTAHPGPTFHAGTAGVWDVELNGVQLIAITTEPEGGSAQPTTTPLIKIPV